MKILSFIILCSLPFLLFGQLEPTLIKSRGYFKELQIQPEFTSSVDSIYPDSKFIYRTEGNRSSIDIFCILENDTLYYENYFSEITLKNKYNKDIKKTYTDNASIKSFIYFNFIANQFDNNRGHSRILSYKISKVRESAEYRDYALFIDSSAKFNYVVEIDVEPCSFSRYKLLRNVTKLKYYINTYDGIVRYFYIEQVKDMSVAKTRLVMTSAAYDYKRNISNYSLGHIQSISREVRQLEQDSTY